MITLNLRTKPRNGGFVRRFFQGYNGPDKELTKMQSICASAAEGVTWSTAKLRRSAARTVGPVVVEYAEQLNKRMEERSEAYFRQKTKERLLGLLIALGLCALGLLFIIGLANSAK